MGTLGEKDEEIDTACVGIVEARILVPAGRRSAYSYSPRSDAANAHDLRGVP